MCVQRFDDSLNSAIHITYRISLRSSSMREPRDPLLKVFSLLRSFLLPWRAGHQTEGPPVGWAARFARGPPPERISPGKQQGGVRREWAIETGHPAVEGRAGSALRAGS
jgi:hypothetical protein